MNWQPRRVTLVGEIAAAPGLAEAVARACTLPVQVGDPWQGMQQSEFCRRTVSAAPATFAVATGLARAVLSHQRGISLLPRDHAEAVMRRRKEATLAAILGISTVVLLAVCLLAGRALGTAEKQRDDLQMQVKSARAKALPHGVRPTPTSLEASTVVKGIINPDRQPLELLRRCSEVLPRGISLSEFIYQQDKSLLLKGHAPSSAMIADAVAALEGFNIFDVGGVHLDFVNSRKEGLEGYDFQISCAFPNAKRSTGRPIKNNDR
jgi:hypothetical protein